MSTTCVGASAISEPIGAALAMTDLRNLLATVLLLALGVVMATDKPRYTVVRTEDTS